MPDTTRRVTAEELERFPDDDYRYELVRGRIIRMSPVGYLHGRIVVRLAAELERHARPRQLGDVLTEVGFKLETDPDTVRAPDVAFIRQDRIATTPKGFWKGPPDLAVEVLSPDDRPSEIDAKVEEYLAHGALVVVVVDPERRTVSTVRADRQPTVLTDADARLDLDDVVPGFSCAVRDIFG